MACFYRENQQYHLGYLFSRVVCDTPHPEDILFIEKSIYEYEMWMEFAQCCERLGKSEEGLRACDAVLANPCTPESVRQAAEKMRRLWRSNALEARRIGADE